MRMRTNADGVARLLRQADRDLASRESLRPIDYLEPRCVSYLDQSHMPKDAKPFRGIGSGVFEIAVQYDGDAYGTVLAVQLGSGDTIHNSEAFRWNQRVRNQRP